MKITAELFLQGALAFCVASAAFAASGEGVVEIKAFQHPDKRGGLMLNIRVDGGEWRDAAGRDRVFGLDPAAPAVQYAYRLGFDAVALNTSSPRRILQNAAYASAKVPAEFWNGL